MYEWQIADELAGWEADKHWCAVCEKLEALADAMRQEKQSNFGLKPALMPPREEPRANEST